MTPKTLFACALAATMLYTAAPLRAELSIELLNGDIPAARLDTLIEQNAGEPALAFDLLGLKVDALVNEGALEAAAGTIAVQIAFAARHADVIEVDLADLHLDAADYLVQAGAAEAAIEQLNAALDALRARAADRALIADVMGQIADLEEARGQVERAEALRQSAQNLPGSTETPQDTRSNDWGFVRVNVFYATDRALTGKTRPSRMFGGDRADGLNYGLAEVTLPSSHAPGALEAPSVWRLEFYEDPAKHVMLQSVTPVAKGGFFASMQGHLQDSGANDAFVFVHGYNVSFDNAAKRTAQLAYDMNFQGLPVLYSWPSRGATVGYIPDTAVVRSSGRHLTTFLEDLVAKSGAKTIHLIAHSMGNRAMTDALELMALRRAPVEKPIFDQVIFAAPDVDQGLFAQMVNTIRPLAERLTLYASDQDWALEASRKLHGNRPRAGQGGEFALVHDLIDTIDMSDLGNDMLAHSYVANEQSAILDISMLFWRNLDPANRCGLQAIAPQIWKYARARCSDSNLLPFISTLRNKGATSRVAVQQALRSNYADADQLREFEPLLLRLAED